MIVWNKQWHKFLFWVNYSFNPLAAIAALSIRSVCVHVSTVLTFAVGALSYSNWKVVSVYQWERLFKS